MAESWQLRLGEERAVKLPAVEPPGGWSAEVSGMESSVGLQKMWPSDPYPEHDEDEDGPSPQRYMVFMVRGVAPGEATVTFTATGEGALPEPRQIDVRVAR